jgi:hypothetical protein
VKGSGEIGLFVIKIITGFEGDAAGRRGGCNYSKTLIRGTDLIDLDKILLVWTGMYALDVKEIER